jgi:hypothetical protein
MNKVRIWEIALFVLLLGAMFWCFHQFGGAPSEREIVDGRHIIHIKGSFRTTTVSQTLYYFYTVLEIVFVPYFIYFVWKYLRLFLKNL